MSVMASWSSKRWEINSKQIKALNGITAGVKVQTLSNDDKEGSPASTTVALEQQSISLGWTVSAAAGVDVREEYESWLSLIGRYAPFYLGGKRFGPKLMQLTVVNLASATLDNRGRMLFGDLNITLTEYAEEASSAKETASSTSINAAATSAVSVGPTSRDKAARKNTNLVLQ